MTDVDARPAPRSALVALVLALTSALLVLIVHPRSWPWWDVLLALGMAGVVGAMLRAALASEVHARFGSIELPEGVTVEATPRRESDYRSAPSVSRPAHVTVTIRTSRHRHAMLAGASAVAPLVAGAFLMRMARDPGVGATLALAIGLVPGLVWGAFALEGARPRRIEIDAERRVLRIDGARTTLVPPGARLTARRVHEGKAVQDELILEHRDSAHRLLRHALAEQEQFVAVAQVIAESVGAVEVVVLDES
ncbi:MAG: hypothetical protein J0L92_29760 [Deltaproteobacteria bacterium]|nr:hypothetical protein [Deltaproteobacteria bacterium]